MDIRSRPRAEWGRLLREKWPQPMDESLGWTPEEGSAVVCVVIVMRMVISYTDSILQPGKDELEWVKAEKAAEGQNVLLRYAWHDTSEGAEAAAVRALQEEVYTELMRAGGQWARAVSGGVTFENIMESLPMWKHFWSRPELTLWTGLELEQTDDWAPLERVLKSDGTEASAAMLARQSLIPWRPEDMTLEQRVSRPSVTQRFDDEQQERTLRHVQRWSRGSLKCIRVEYDQGAGGELTACGFEDLVRLSISPEVLEVQGGKAKWVDGTELSYRLVAVVKLGSPAHIRTYDKAGQDLVPRALSPRDVVCLNNDWKLGQLGTKYMLYYVLAKPWDPREVPAALERGHEGAVDLRQQQGRPRRIERSSPPRDAPTGPRAQREQAEQAPSAPREHAKVFGANAVPLGRTRQLGQEALAEPSSRRSDSPRDPQGPGAPAPYFAPPPPALYGPHFPPRRRRRSPDPPRDPQGPGAPAMQFPPRPRRQSVDPPGPPPAPPPPAPHFPPRRRRWSPDPPGPGPPAMQFPPQGRTLSGEDDSQRAEASGVPRQGVNPSTTWRRPPRDLVPQKRRLSGDDER